MDEEKVIARLLITGTFERRKRCSFILFSILHVLMGRS